MKGNYWNWGFKDAPICLVGEAPGRMEMAGNEPLIGPAGRINDECLHSAGVIKRELRILNLVDTPIPDGSKFHNNGVLHPDIIPHRERTIKLLQKSKARVIVPLGGLALAALLGREGILKWRGSVIPCPFKKDAVIVPTIHPAATMRGMYLWRYLIQRDYQKVKRLSMAKRMLPNPTIIIDPSWKEVVDFLKYVKDHDRAAYDVEIYNRQISCVSFSVKYDEGISIPFVNDRGTHRWTLEEELLIWSMVEGIVSDPNIANINQNILFDHWCLAYLNHILPAGPSFDPMVGQHVMYPDFPKALEFITSIRTDYEYYKDDRKLWRRIKEDPRTFWTYSAKDAIVPLIAWDDIDEEMDDEYRAMHDFIIRKFPALLHMMCRGVKVNMEALERTKIAVGKKLEAAESELERVADYPFNPGSPKQCMEYFYEHKKIKAYTSRTTGAPTSDDKAMQRLFSRHGLKEARLVQEIRGLRKLQGTYLEMELDTDGRFRSSYNPRGTRNMRLSSSRTVFETGGGAQNLDPAFTAFLVSD